ncbi:MAG: stage II sporulation protein M [Candidatus Bathyarchaeia archaeon]
MPYCRKCGAPLPEEAIFCPNCGVAITPKRGEMRVPPISKRLAVIIVFVILIAVTFVGANSPIDPSEAGGIVEEIENMVPSLQLIFGNNFMHCLIMFTPVLGPVWAGYVLYSTGKVFAAFGYVSKISPNLLFGITFLFPHAWLEYLAYTLAVSQSIWLVLMAWQHQLRAELKNLYKMVTVCALLLLLAAFIETLLFVFLR